MDEDGNAISPYRESGSKLPVGPNGKYRHIASYTMKELMALGWDGATYVSTRGQGRHAADSHHVPFVCGYDSDSEDEYEPIDIAKGKREGVIGIPQEGLYVNVPNPRDEGRPQLVHVRNVR